MRLVGKSGAHMVDAAPVKRNNMRAVANRRTGEAGTKQIRQMMRGGVRIIEQMSFQFGIKSEFGPGAGGNQLVQRGQSRQNVPA